MVQGNGVASAWRGEESEGLLVVAEIGREDDEVSLRSLKMDKRGTVLRWEALIVEKRGTMGDKLMGKKESLEAEERKREFCMVFNIVLGKTSSLVHEIFWILKEAT